MVRATSDELFQLRDRAVLMLRMLKKHSSNQNGLFEQFEQAVEQAVSRRSGKALKTLVSDLSEWCAALPPSARTELNELLLAGQKGSESEAERIARAAKKILDGDSIQTAEQYRVLIRYRGLMQADVASHAELDRLDEMLRRADLSRPLPE